MSRDLQVLSRIGVGLLSLLLVGDQIETPLARQLPNPAGTSTPGTSPETAWLQTLAVLLGPSLTTAIRQGRDHAYPHGQAVPAAIRHTLAPFFARTVLQKVRYSTAWRDVTAQATLYSVLLGAGAHAVTLIDVIIFRDAQQAADPLLWAHELTHVEQYDRLGVDAFARQYLEQAWVLEDEALAKVDTIKRQLSP